MGRQFFITIPIRVIRVIRGSIWFRPCGFEAVTFSAFSAVSIRVLRRQKRMWRLRFSCGTDGVQGIANDDCRTRFSRGFHSPLDCARKNP